MKTRQIVILCSLFALLLGLAIGFGFGVKAGVETAGTLIGNLINKVQVNNPSFNVDLNETAIITGLTPLLNQTAK